MGDDNLSKRIFSNILFDVSHPTSYLIKTYFQFFIDMISSKIHFTPNLSSESFHWKRFYHQCSIDNPNQIILPRETITKDSILFALNRLKSEFKGNIYCLDVGCGPTSQFYTEQLKDDQQLQIISVDPLAEVYKEIHRKYKTGYNIECVKGYAETLNEIFPEKNFHLIYTQNAIDHSQNPINFFRQCYNLIIDGGYFILHGFIKEGTAAKWLGLHKWDIEVNENTLLLTDKHKNYNKFNIGQDCDLTLVYKKITGYNIGDMYTLIYKKTSMKV